MWEVRTVLINEKKLKSSFTYPWFFIYGHVYKEEHTFHLACYLLFEPCILWLIIIKAGISRQVLLHARFNILPHPPHQTHNKPYFCNKIFETSLVP